MKKQVYILFLLLIPAFCMGQNERVTETVVQAEAKFLDALQLRMLEKWDEALDAFRELSVVDPGNDVVIFEIAKIYYQKGDTQNALQYAKNAVKVNPERPVYREFLIDLLSSLGDYEALNQQLNYFIQHGTFSEEYYFQLASGFEKLGKFKDAVKVLEELEDRTGYTIRLGKAYVRNYQKQNNNKKIRAELDKLTTYFPGEVDVLIHKAILLDSIHEDKEALETYREVLKYEPNNVAANMYLATRIKQASTEREFLQAMFPLVENEGIPMDEKIKQLIPYIPRLNEGSAMLDDMIQLVEKLEVLYPDEAKIYALHGDIYFNAGQFDQAALYYEKTIAINKGVFLVWKQLMMALDQTLQFDRLKNIAENAIDYYPNQAVSYYYKGKACIETGSVREGIEWLEEGIWMSANNSKLEAEFRLMKVYGFDLEGKYTEAEKLFRAIDPDQLGRDHAFYHEVKGDLHYSRKQMDEAVTEWQNALEMGGRNDRLTQKIKMVEK